MARFLGAVKGGGSETTRLGHKTTGLHVRAQSYTGTIFVDMYDFRGEDYVQISSSGGSTSGSGMIIYNGPVKTLTDSPTLNTLLRDLAINTIAEAAE